MIHLQGLGVVGSLLAARLSSEGYDFSWSDIDHPTTAWKASTGCVFPTGDPFDHDNYVEWHRLLMATTDFRRWVSKFTEEGLWSYISKSAPHGGLRMGVRPMKQVGPISLTIDRTIHFNVQQLVRESRRRFALLRTDKPGKGERVIITHGTASAIRYTWGWSAHVGIRMSPALVDAVDRLTNVGARPCLYLRSGYVVNYIYPRPNTLGWYGGTAAVSQKEPKKRRPPDPAEWASKVQDLTDANVLVNDFQHYRQGWRPVPDPEAPLLAKVGRKLYVRPQGGNGLRHAPSYMNAVLEAL